MPFLLPKYRFYSNLPQKIFQFLLFPRSDCGVEDLVSVEPAVVVGDIVLAVDLIVESHFGNVCFTSVHVGLELVVVEVQAGRPNPFRFTWFRYVGSVEEDAARERRISSRLRVCGMGRERDIFLLMEIRNRL